jgi:acetoin utilization deacetylase AcuC-like enzyme
MKRVALIRDPLFLKHRNRLGEPEEVPARLEAIDGMLARHPLRAWMRDLPARDAAFEELARVHTADYIRRVEGTREAEDTVLDESTSACPDSHAAAVRAAGACLSAVEAVLAPDGPEPFAASFALVRPPGHHAERGRAMGFCLFNNAAVAAAEALRCGIARILIVDWDLHHGNGTMHAFYESERVLFFSVHQFPEYPGSGAVEETGSGAGLGYSINVPFPVGQGDREYLAAFRKVLLPAAREFHPGLILVSAGFDIHGGDPLGGMKVSAAGFGGMTAVVRQIASECCPGRLVFCLEGGYGLEGLAGGVSSVLSALLEEAKPEEEPGPVGAEADAVLDRVRAALGPYWPSLR